MSRGRRHVLQLDDSTSRSMYSNEPTYSQEMEQDEEDDEDAGDIPTPERLVTEDMIPDSYRLPGYSIPPPPGGEMDNKVANFLAEIDALEEPISEQQTSSTYVTSPHRDISPAPDSHSPVRSKVNAYSNMFVKGTPEFVKSRPDDHKHDRHVQKEPWPAEPTTDWQQLKDEKTNYPYYWNMTTNEVVWDMPQQFSQYLILHKEYEERVEKGLREGTLDPAHKQPGKGAPDSMSNSTTLEQSKLKLEDKASRHQQKKSKHENSSQDSSTDSSDSDTKSPRQNRPRSPKKQERKSPKNEVEKGQHEVTSSSSNNSRDSDKHVKTTVSPDTTRQDDKKPLESTEADDSMDFDIDDIDKQLELALDKKTELMKAEEEKEKKEDSKVIDKESQPKDRDRDRNRDRDEDRHRKHDRHDKDRDRDRRQEREPEHEEKKPKLTLKERLRIEMELKLEKERRKKKAIEDLMARELEHTVVNRRGHKRHSEERERPQDHKRYRHDDKYPSGRDRGYGDLHRDDYDSWDRRGDRYASYDYRFEAEPMYKPPPPTEEMLAYKEEKRSQVVDYGHGRSRQNDLNGDSDQDVPRSG